MGLLDKLRDGIGAVLGTNESPAKRYYGVILVLLSAVEHLTKDQMQEYFRVKYNEECDDVALDKALSKFKVARESTQQRTWYELTYEQWEKERIEVPSATKEEILDICYARFRKNVKRYVRKLLSVLDQKPEKRLFEEGLRKLVEVGLHGQDVSSLERELIGKIISEAMIERLLAKDPTAITIVTEEVIEHLRNHKSIQLGCALALRALCFEKNSANLGEYQSITFKDCCSVVVNTSFFTEKLRANPSYKDATIERNARIIYESETFETYYNAGIFKWRKWAAEDVRFVDGACYYAVQEMSKYFKNHDTKTLESTVDLIADFVTKIR